MTSYNPPMIPIESHGATQVPEEDRPASQQVIQAQRQWLKDGTVPPRISLTRSAARRSISLELRARRRSRLRAGPNVVVFAQTSLYQDASTANGSTFAGSVGSG